MGERRESKRQKSFLRGCIYFNNRRSAIDCLVRDISAAGARLIFSEVITLPDVVDLYIPQKEETLRAHVHWRHGDEIGVGFARAGARSIDRGLAERVEKLEIEIAELRRLLKRLKAGVADRDEEAA
jgi:PilZ domain-containing protein